jgi:prevent-host-death family protein
MKTKTYSVSEARQHWAEIIAAVERGEEVAITKYGRTVASISSPRKKKQKTPPPPGFLEAEGWRLEMADDFDALPEGFEDYV